MELSHILGFNMALFAALISPGPALLVSVQTSLMSGRIAGISAGVGLAFVASIWTLCALLGLEVVFAIFPWAYVAVKVVGALYLIYVAIAMWRGANKPLRADVKPAKRAFRHGMMINLLNPKSILFAAAVLVVIFPKNMGWTENAFVVLNHFVVEVVFYGTVAIGMSRARVRERYLSAKAYIDRASSLVLGALGVRLLLSR
ncbi:MAG: LysE family translocator [Paracoccaceae bacterium]